MKSLLLPEEFLTNDQIDFDVGVLHCRALTESQLALLTIDSQKARISELETETETQRVEIDNLTKRVSENSNNLAAIAEIRHELTAIRLEMATLKGLHNK